jgi:hypothetical protein
MYAAGSTHDLISLSILMASSLVACSSAAPGKAIEPSSTQASAADWHSDKHKAEYAFRWYLPQQDFESAEDAVQWLQQHGGFLHPQREGTRTVVYFTIAKPLGLPDGYDASFRLRGTDDYTYKVRGPAPWPETLTAPSCNASKVDVEYDVSIGSDGKVAKVMASHSCDGDSKSKFGSEFATTPMSQRPCTISMERTRLDWHSGTANLGKERKELKVEQWIFSHLGYERKLVEISWKAKATQADEDIFSALVESLPKGFPMTLPPSKESTAAECDAGT